MNICRIHYVINTKFTFLTAILFMLISDPINEANKECSKNVRKLEILEIISNNIFLYKNFRYELLTKKYRAITEQVGTSPSNTRSNTRSKMY